MSNVPVDAVGLTRAIRCGIVPHPRSVAVSIAHMLLFLGLEFPQRVEKVVAYENEDHFVITIHYYDECPRVLELSFNSNVHMVYWMYWAHRGDELVAGAGGKAKAEIMRELDCLPVRLSTNLNSRSTIADSMPIKVTLNSNINGAGHEEA